MTILQCLRLSLASLEVYKKQTYLPETNNMLEVYTKQCGNVCYVEGGGGLKSIPPSSDLA